VRALIALALLAAAQPALADDGRAAARTAFSEGTHRYEVGDYAGALEAFKRSYLAYAAPDTLYNIAQCQRQLGQHAEAARLYRNYLELVPAAPDRAEVERQIAEQERAARAAPSPAAGAATVARALPERPRRRWVVPLVVTVAIVAAAAIAVGLALAFAGPSDPVPTLGAYRFGAP
jgi:tetratricopeptide (TPR) repeat protein